jgi:hypothetical protein
MHAEMGLLQLSIKRRRKIFSIAANNGGRAMVKAELMLGKKGWVCMIR